MKATTEPKASLSLLWGTLGIGFLLITMSGINPSALLFLMVLLSGCLFALSYWFRNEPAVPENPPRKSQLSNSVRANDAASPHTALPTVTLSSDTEFAYR